MIDQQSGDSPLSPSAWMELLLEPPEIHGDFVRHSCLIRRVGGVSPGSLRLWFEIPAHIPRIDPSDAEPFLIACLMDAMQEGRDISVRGKVSFQLLSNVHEFMAAWSRWRPEIYRVVAIEVESIAAPPERSNLPHDGAVVFHTGALNSTSTIYRHSRALEGHRSRRIVAGIMIQGHLISLSNGEKFERSLALGRACLADIGAEVLPIRTNFREVIQAHWSDVYGAAFVSALQFFKPLAQSALIGAPLPYDDVDAFPNTRNPSSPYGSNPFSNMLLSSESLQILHDGCRFDFMEKIAMVSEWDAGLRNLRVCWRRSQLEPHCGVCEECVRTKLAFLALSKPIPESMGTPPTAREILNLMPMSSDCRLEIAQVLAHCRRVGLHAPWVRALSLCLRFDRVASKLRHLKWMLLDRFR